MHTGPHLARRLLLKHLPAWSSLFALQTASTPTQAKTFDPVKLGQALSFPRDHGAHLNHRTEWWYVTGFLNPSQGAGESIGFQFTFFRTATGEAVDNPSRFAPKQFLFGHAALAIKSQGKLLHEQTSLRVGFERLTSLSERDTGVRGLRWSIKREASAQADAEYKISADTGQFALNLSLKAPTRPALQGQMGFSQKGPSIKQASYYYSRPQLQVQGQVRIKDVQSYVGSAWMDHEWSNEVLDDKATGWDWIGLNFDDGQSLMAFQIRPRIGSEALWCEARGFNRQGEADFMISAQDDASARRQALAFKPRRFWRSLRSNAQYPVEIDLEIQRPATGKRTLSLRPLMDDQEIDARASTGGYYWEGLVFVFENQKKIGQGYLELTGYAAPLKL